MFYSIFLNNLKMGDVLRIITVICFAQTVIMRNVLKATVLDNLPYEIRLISVFRENSRASSGNNIS